MSTVIHFENVSKKFTLHRERVASFQELALSLFRSHHDSWEKFWALRDVTFEIKAGEAVGIIGPNGAGKSTILKLVSRILEPTSGRVCVLGRVGALLELGAGFHPELTGRENIYLNGSILGLSRADIDRKLDDIIGFAELERFIDVPVKHYSSGMYVRLGFSVAVHTDPEILLVDEVLAVGDSAFQRKCLERIDQMRTDGITLLLVSHSADAVRTICSRAIWFDAGSIVADGTAESVVQRYTMQGWEAEEERLQAKEERLQVVEAARWGTGRVRITQVQLLNKEGKETQLFETGEPLTVILHYEAQEQVEHPVFGLAIHRSDGVHVTGPNTHFAGLDVPSIMGEGHITYSIPRLPLLEGLYALSVATHNWEDTEMYDYHDRLYPFRVRAAEKGELYGIVTVNGQWYSPVADADPRSRSD